MKLVLTIIALNLIGARVTPVWTTDVSSNFTLPHPSSNKNFNDDPGHYKGVIGGKEGNIKDFPYITTMVRKSGIDVSLCGSAVIVHRQWVVTSAVILTKCFEVDDIAHRKMYLHTNTANWKQKYKEHLAVKSYIHQKFNGYDFDIALVKIKTKFTEDNEQPIDIADADYKYKPGTLAAIAGWGWTEINGYKKHVDTLRWFDIKILNSDLCPETHSIILKKNTNRMLCAVGIAKNPCFIDPGSPLVQHATLIGLVSSEATNICYGSTRPGVYTKISVFKKWIHSTIHNKMNKEPHGRSTAVPKMDKIKIN